MTDTTGDASAIDEVRAQFPALALADEGVPRVYFDNPAGTQVPLQVLGRMREYMVHSMANNGGLFRTSAATAALVDLARAKMQHFLNAASAEEIVFGPNMTSLTFHLSRTLEPRLRAGDEILLTRMDHDGNVTPWTLLAERLGLVVRWLDFDPATSRYRLEQLDTLLGPRTRIAAFNYASNITGTVNDVAEIARRVRDVGGLSYVDAVQYAPHGDVDVQALGCDFLVCSAYKFYGPHVGVLWGRKQLLDALTPAKLKAAPDVTPKRFETGCANFEGLAALIGAVEYYEWLGARQGAAQGGGTRAATRGLIGAGKRWMREQEGRLAVRLLRGLEALPGVCVHGLAAGAGADERVSTVSFSVQGRHTQQLAACLAERNVFAWSGHNYALQVIDRLGLQERGGVLRLGPVHYNTIREVEYVLDCLEQILAAAAP